MRLFVLASLDLAILYQQNDHASDHLYRARQTDFEMLVADSHDLDREYRRRLSALFLTLELAVPLNEFSSLFDAYRIDIFH